MTIEERITSLEARAGILLKDDITFNAKNEYSQLEELEKEGSLPKGVYRAYSSDGDELPYFYKVKRETLSREDADRIRELKKLIALRDMNRNIDAMNRSVSTIKGWAVFFGILQVLALLIGMYVGYRLGASIL